MTDEKDQKSPGKPERGNLPADEAKLPKLKEALEIPPLNQLWLLYHCIVTLLMQSLSQL